MTPSSESTFQGFSDDLVEPEGGFGQDVIRTMQTFGKLRAAATMRELRATISDLSEDSAKDALEFLLLYEKRRAIGIDELRDWMAETS